MPYSHQGRRLARSFRREARTAGGRSEAQTSGRCGNRSPSQISQMEWQNRPNAPGCQCCDRAEPPPRPLQYPHQADRSKGWNDLEFRIGMKQDATKLCEI